MSNKMNWQYEMLSAFICVLLTKEWDNICEQYKTMKEGNNQVFVHINYTNNAEPNVSVNTDKRYRMEGTALTILKDEYFDPTKETKMHIAYLLADSIPDYTRK